MKKIKHYLEIPKPYDTETGGFYSPSSKEIKSMVSPCISPVRRKSILKSACDSFGGSPLTKNRKTSRVSFNLIDDVWRSELILQHMKDFQDKKDSDGKKGISLNIPNNVRTVNLDVKNDNNPAIYITQNNKNNYSIVNNNVQSKPKNFTKRNSVVVGLTDASRKRIMSNKDLNDIYSEKTSCARSQLESERGPNNIDTTKNPQLMINIYKVNQRNGEKDTDVSRRNEESFTKLQTLNDFRKEEYKQLIDDPNYFKLVYEKKVGVISGFCANTFKNFKGKNEDKINVGINLKLKKLQNQNYVNEDENKKENNINFFSVFDGHGGETVAEELKQNLREFILSDLNILDDTEGALMRGFSKVEESVINKNKPKENTEIIIDKSGSCALAVLLINDICFVANLGDSRAIISKGLGKKINALSIDHKPGVEDEKQRILASGGFVYHSETLDTSTPLHNIAGVFRTSPGRLAVSRTIGDVEAKIEAYGGLPGVVIAIPDIISFKIENDVDFIVLGSDGLFDKLPNKDITIIVLETIKTCIKSDTSYSDMLVKVTNKIIMEAIDRESKDNISCIFLCFNNLFQTFINKKIEEIEFAIRTLRSYSMDFNDLYEKTISKSLYKLKTPSKDFKNILDKNIVQPKGSPMSLKGEFEGQEKGVNSKDKQNRKKGSACSCSCYIF